MAKASESPQLLATPKCSESCSSWRRILCAVIALRGEYPKVPTLPVRAIRYVGRVRIIILTAILLIKTKARVNMAIILASFCSTASNLQDCVCCSSVISYGQLVRLVAGAATVQSDRIRGSQMLLTSTFPAVLVLPLLHWRFASPASSSSQ